MSGTKKDLTRIEDLGEFLHELSQEDDVPFEDAELPAPPEEGAFQSSFEESTQANFGTTTFQNDFASEELSAVPASEDFGALDFGEELEAPEPPEAESFPETQQTYPALVDEVREQGPYVPSTPTPLPTSTPVEESSYAKPEDFSEVKAFAERSAFGTSQAESNPSFSVLIRNVRFSEDVDEILTVLKELKLLSDNEEHVRGRLGRGQLLVPRISEYAAIFLAHKLRRFDLDLQVGLTDEIHPPKGQERAETGLVSRSSLYQNQTHQFSFDHPKLDLSQIVVASTATLEGHQVVKYMGVASEHKMIGAHLVENEDSEEMPRLYTELAQKLKAHALKAHANAVVGLNYQLTPLPSEIGISQPKYRLTCTGNLVWVSRL